MCDAILIYYPNVDRIGNEGDTVIDSTTLALLKLTITDICADWTVVPNLSRTFNSRSCDVGESISCADSPL